MGTTSEQPVLTPPLFPGLTAVVPCRSVYYQDQSKRKETRMILFFVCAKCSHSFLDPNLKVSGRADDVDMGD